MLSLELWEALPLIPPCRDVPTVPSWRRQYNLKCFSLNVNNMVRYYSGSRKIFLRRDGLKFFLSTYVRNKGFSKIFNEKCLFFKKNIQSLRQILHTMGQNQRNIWKHIESFKKNFKIFNIFIIKIIIFPQFYSFY